MVTRSLSLLVALLLALCWTGCKQQAPSPWNEMKFPLRHGEILPGADANNLKVLYRSTDRRKDLYREFRRSLERSGYKHERDGKAHDPPGNTYSGVFKKEAAELLLTVSGAGVGDTNVEVKRLDWSD